MQVQNKIPVRRQIWPFGSRLGLSEISTDRLVISSPPRVRPIPRADRVGEIVVYMYVGPDIGSVR